MIYKHRPLSAFSLVELSIVLVILGLLVGGVLSGQSLIRAAELRSITTQYSKFIAAGQSFRDKYFALPGDMTNASTFWGAADGSSGNTAGCKSTVGTGTVTCNGNGDGLINSSTASAEIYRLWQHLANAGLIEGNYTGVDTGANFSTTLNSPIGKMASSMWFVYDWGPISGNAAYYNNDYTNSLVIGPVVANSWPGGPLFKPEEAWNIDTKLDDGNPGTGRVSTYGVYAGTCSTSASTSTTGAYNLSNSSPACFLVFPRAFY